MAEQRFSVPPDPTKTATTQQHRSERSEQSNRARLHEQRPRKERTLIMILRLWRGWTSTEATSTAYRELLTGQIAPAILARGIPGLRDLTVWRRDPSELGGPGAGDPDRDDLRGPRRDHHLHRRRPHALGRTGGGPAAAGPFRRALPALHRRRPLRLITAGSFKGGHDSLSMTVFVSSTESNLRCHESCGQR